MANNQKTPAPTAASSVAATRAELAAQAVALQAEASDLTLPAARMIEVRIRLAAIQGAIRDIDSNEIPAKRRELLAKADACHAAAKAANGKLDEIRKQGYGALDDYVMQFLFAGIGPKTSDAQVEEAIAKFGPWARMRVAVERLNLEMISNMNQAASFREDAEKLIQYRPSPVLA